MLRATQAAPVEDVETGATDAHARRPAGSRLDQAARAALGGDPFALRQFLRAIVPLVRSVCRGVMGRDNPELEDAIQDCLIDIVRALPQFRFESEVTHYVTKIALRRAIASRERERARHKRHQVMDPHSLPVVVLDEPIETRANLVRNSLDALTETQATVLRLRLMLGHSIGEIATITGVSVNTVKTRLRLGKNQLRRLLKRSGEGPRAR